VLSLNLPASLSLEEQEKRCVSLSSTLFYTLKDDIMHVNV